MIQLLQTPSGPGIRDDSGVYEGWTVPIDYDPLISKLVAWGPTRPEAMARMQRALREYRVKGIQTNLSFFRELLNDSDFRSGHLDTGFIEKWMKNRIAPSPPTQVELDLAVLSAILAEMEKGKTAAELGETDSNGIPSLWKTTGRRESLRH
jgi:acetyl-CoA carboxylase biotin carboxylase subunit